MQTVELGGSVTGAALGAFVAFVAWLLLTIEGAASVVLSSGGNKKDLVMRFILGLGVAAVGFAVGGIVAILGLPLAFSALAGGVCALVAATIRRRYR